MAIGPEETQQRLHRDADSWLRAGFERDFLFSVNIALTDFRREPEEFNLDNVRTR